MHSTKKELEGGKLLYFLIQPSQLKYRKLLLEKLTREELLLFEGRGARDGKLLLCLTISPSVRWPQVFASLLEFDHHDIEFR
jgi:hypothetical protein